MDLRQLEAFFSISTSGSFSAAARQLNLTQSALSHQIRNLEEELGCELLVRAKPRVYPTADGHTLLSSTSRIISELSEIKSRFGLSGSRHGRAMLRIAATNVGLCYMYGNLCERFLKQHPEVDLRIMATESTDEAVLKVAKRATDIALAPLPIDVSNVEGVLLGAAEQVFVVGAQHKFAKRQTITVSELQSCSFIRYLPGSGGRVASDGVFLANGGYPPIMTESNDTEFVKRIAAMNLAAALVPIFTIVNELRSRRLIAIRLTGRKLMQQFGFVYCRDLRTRALDSFKQLCFEYSDLQKNDITLENANVSPWVAMGTSNGRTSEKQRKARVKGR